MVSRKDAKKKYKSRNALYFASLRILAPLREIKKINN
jgi:hypothetical protein